MRVLVKSASGEKALLKKSPEDGKWVSVFTGQEYVTDEPRQLAHEIMLEIDREIDKPVTKEWIADNCLVLKRGSVNIGALFKTPYAWRAVPSGVDEHQSFQTAKEAELYIMAEAKGLLVDKHTLEVVE